MSYQLQFKLTVLKPPPRTKLSYSSFVNCMHNKFLQMLWVKKIVFFGACCVFISAIVVAVVMYQRKETKLGAVARYLKCKLTAFYVVTKFYHHSNGYECSKIGKKIFEQGGNVADVAVAMILCEGISNPQSW